MEFFFNIEFSNLINYFQIVLKLPLYFNNAYILQWFDHIPLHQNKMRIFKTNVYSPMTIT